MTSAAVEGSFADASEPRLNPQAAGLPFGARGRTEPGSRTAISRLVV